MVLYCQAFNRYGTLSLSCFYHILLLKCDLTQNLLIMDIQIILEALMKKRLLCTLLILCLVFSPLAPIGGQSQDTAKSAAAAGENTPSTGTSPFTKSTYTHAAAYSGLNVYHGIDVSYHNGAINWEKAAAAGVEYAFIRVGYRGWGSGTIVDDPRFKTYITDALNAGVHVGLYFFTEAINETEAKQEAEYCLEIAKNYDINLPIAFDYEYQYSDGKLVSRKAGLSKTKATANCRAFCDTIAAGGYTPMIYANSSDLKTLIDGASLEKDYLIWLANYTTKTTYTGLYEIWQYSSKGSVNGLSGNVDCNFWYSDTDITQLNFNSGDLKDAAIASIPAQIYTGSEIKPTVSVTMGRRALKAGRDYTVSYANNKKPGKATITIKGKGNITGTRTKTFTIKPKQLSKLTAKSGTKKVTLTWKGATGGDGYEIYRTNVYNGTYKKVKTVTKASAKKWTNSGLSSNREYFYKVRAYRKVDGNYYYGAYTKISAGTTPGGKAFVAPYNLKLLKKPSKKAGKRVTIPGSATAVYVGRTVLANKTKFYHVQYRKSGKTYDGYLTTIKGLKMRKMKTTTTKTALKASARSSAKTLVKIPGKTPVVILKTKKAGKKTWYETTYLKGKKYYTGFVCADTLE